MLLALVAEGIQWSQPTGRRAAIVEHYTRVSRLMIANTALIITQDPVPIIDLHGPSLQVMLGFQETSLTTLHHTTPSLDPRRNGPSGV